MRLYLAGPMRGIPLYNFPAFHAAAARLRALGYEVVNPAEMDEQQDSFNPARDAPDPETGAPVGFTVEHFARRDIDILFTVEGLAVLPGWRQATGARAEVAVGRWLRKRILDAETLEEISQGMDP